MTLLVRSRESEPNRAEQSRVGSSFLLGSQKNDWWWSFLTHWWLFYRSHLELLFCFHFIFFIDRVSIWSARLDSAQRLLGQAGSYYRMNEWKMSMNDLSFINMSRDSRLAGHVCVSLDLSVLSFLFLKIYEEPQQINYYYLLLPLGRQNRESISFKKYSFYHCILLPTVKCCVFEAKNLETTTEQASWLILSYDTAGLEYLADIYEIFWADIYYFIFAFKNMK